MVPKRRSVSHQAFSEPGVATAFGPIEVLVADGVEHVMRRARRRSV